MRRLSLVRAYRRSFFGESQVTEPSRFLEDIPLRLVSTQGAGGSNSSAGLRSTVNRRGSLDDDNDYNQDTYSSSETGPVFAFGKPGAASQPRQSPTRPASTNHPP